MQEEQLREKIRQEMDDFALEKGAPPEMFRAITLEKMRQEYAALPHLHDLWAEMETAGKTGAPEDILAYLLAICDRNKPTQN